MTMTKRHRLKRKHRHSVDAQRRLHQQADAIARKQARDAERGEQE